MTKGGAIVLAIVIGSFYALQAAVNSNMGRSVNPRIVALQTIIVAGILVVILNLFPFTFNEYPKVYETPPFYWVAGGAIGLSIIFANIFIVPILGSRLTIAIAVAMQLITSSFLDHYGLFGLDKNPMTLVKVMGMILMMAGVKLILS